MSVPGGSGRANLRAWARRHAYSLLSSVGSLVRHPMASALTIAVLAIALMLPVAASHERPWRQRARQPAGLGAPPCL